MSETFDAMASAWDEGMARWSHKSFHIKLYRPFFRVIVTSSLPPIAVWPTVMPRAS